MKQELRQLLRQETSIVGQTKAVRSMLEFAEQVAKSNHTILLQGETGVGKDLFAAFIHYHARPEFNFVEVDCGALSEGLSESELFGHAKGAFTDATCAKRGLIQEAENGTIFFNEVANMSPVLQRKFLRIVERKSYRPLGETHPLQFGARIIAATNANLEEACKRGELRADLLHRLKVLTYTIPPLRQRIDDIPILVQHFLQRDEFIDKEFTDRAIESLQQYHWPGNVRELRNVVTATAALGGTRRIDEPDVTPYTAGGIDPIEQFFKVDGGQPFPTFKEVRRGYLREALLRSDGSVRRAAELAGLSPKTVYNDVRSFQLEGLVSSRPVAREKDVL